MSKIVHCIRNKFHVLVATSESSQLNAWVKADKILRPDVDCTRYPMKIENLKEAGYYYSEGEKDE